VINIVTTTRRHFLQFKKTGLGVQPSKAPRQRAGERQQSPPFPTPNTPQEARKVTKKTAFSSSLSVSPGLYFFEAKRA